MGEERWLTVWELFSCVYDMPVQERAAFLESNSPGPEVRGQVLALLEVSQSCTQEDSVFLPPAPGPEYPVGHQLGRYMIVGLIGQGGFGRIYAAHDKDLDRVVALKVLSRPLAGNRDRQIEEARAASALNHPNIVTVYEAISADDHVAIAMEFVDGQSLRQMLNETAGPVALEKVIRYGRQMAEALKAAHEAGITHRDVKPENILVRKDQYVKLVDFGLATHLVTSPDTGAGGLTGTLRYISPERLRGEPSSRASDIFALGLVLYEMTAGVHAFPGKTPLDAAAAIAATHPLPPSRKAPHIPPQLDRLIMAMLHKDPRARPTAEQVAGALEQPKTTLKTGWVWLATLAAAFLAAALLAWFVVRKKDSADFSDLKIQPLTSQPGWEASPAFSPDGESIAFTWAERSDTPAQLYVKQLNDSAPIKLTDAHSEGTIGPLVWSPDGKSIAFKREYKESGAIFAIPSSGGNEKKILDLKRLQLSARIDWSPEGAELAFSDVLPGSERLAIYLFDLRTGKRRKLTSPPPGDAGDWNPKFSPDGRTIAFKRVSGFWADNMYTVPVAGGEPRRLTWERRGIWGHAWTADGKSLIVSCQRGASIFGLWRFPLASPSRPERILQGGLDAITPATSYKTKRLAWVNQTQDVNIYRVSIAGGEQPVRLIASTQRDQSPAYSAGGQIAFVSDRSGSREIWLAHADGTGQKRITSFNGPDVGDLQWSPDGRRLAFYSRAQGHSDIFTLDCGPASMVCENPKRVISVGKAEVPSWSADGEFLYFASDRTGRWEVWKQAISGGQPVQITQNGGYAARESRDGKWLYFSKDGGQDIWRIPVARSGGRTVSAEELVIGPPNHVQQKGWTLLPDGIVFTEPPEKGQPGALRVYRFSNKRTRLILPMMEGFVDGREYGVSVSPDLKWVLYSELDRSGSNVMVAEANK